MTESHAPTKRQLRRIEVFETEILPRLMQRKDFAATLAELEQIFGSVLGALMTIRPKKCTGVWRLATPDRLSRARRLILARALMFARHNQKRAGSAQVAKGELTRLADWLLATPNCVGHLNASTEKYIGTKNPEALEKFATLSALIDDLYLLISDLADNYPTKKLQGVSSKANATIDFLTLVYLDTTGVYPSLSAGSRWPELNFERVELTLVAPVPVSTTAWPYADLPPFLRIIKHAVDVVESASRARRPPAKSPKAKRARRKEKRRSRKLSPHALEKRFDTLKRKTLTVS